MENTNSDTYQFLHSYYFREKFEKVGRSYNMTYPDALIIVYKKNGEQTLKVLESPEFTFRMAKPEIKIDYNLDNIKLDDTIPVTIKYRDLFKCLAELSGQVKEFYEAKSNGDYEFIREMQNNLQRYPRFFGSDINIDNYYKMYFYKKYGNKIGDYKKSYLDIEVDAKDYGYPDPMRAPCPVYLLSFFIESENTMFTYILDDSKKYKGLPDFKKNLDKFVKEELMAEISNTINYKMKFFENEVDLIKSYFETMHKYKPDFCQAWNFTFDIMTLINRLRNFETVYGYKTENIVCHSEIPEQYRQIYYKEDKDPRVTEFQNLWHWLSIPGYTQWICSMSMYANIRKSEGKEPSYSLNDIAFKELGIGKLDYSDIAYDVMSLPYIDISRAIKYNILDTYLLFLLENKNNDIDKIMYQAQVTKLSSCTKVTATIKNMKTIFYEKMGLAIGNNVNALMYGGKEESFAGAIVSDPSLNNKHASRIFDYMTSTIFTYVIDNDLTSMYPSIMVAHNIYRTTLLFHITRVGTLMNLPNESLDRINLDSCFDNLQTEDYIRFGSQYLNLPSLERIIDIINKKILN